MPDLAEVTEQIRARVSAAGALAKSYKLDFGDMGKIHIADGAVSNDDGPADCTIHIDFSDFLSLASGQLDPMGAFMSGKMKIDGNPMDALALQPVLKG
jgi:putative sterol carrier protein